MSNTTLAHKICIAYRHLFNVRESQPLNAGTISAMEELGLILKPIYQRMRKEGWVLQNGKLTKHE
ncbi:hypothetical protein CL655_03785 [bacterium]|nr:hypothetical protein [bacterium]|tara:strand:- start:894 stop:1088 length:195 start_codon:yes stop_codon:yes gene_type:complete